VWPGDCVAASMLNLYDFILAVFAAAASFVRSNAHGVSRSGRESGLAMISLMADGRLK